MLNKQLGLLRGPLFVSALWASSSVSGQWQSLSGGVDEFVRCFVASPDSSTLLVGGNFKYVRQGSDSLLAAGLARWDGISWSISDLSPPPLDSIPSVSRYVLSVLEVADTIFTSHGGSVWPNSPQLDRAAMLSGSIWESFGEPDQMLDFKQLNHRYFVGGEASTVFGSFMPGVREWKNGTLVQLPGSPFTQNVDIFGFEHWHGKFYFAGNTWGELGSSDIVAYDGDSTWSGVGGGMGSGWLRAVAGLGDSLYVGGYFFEGGNNLSTHVQIFDGSAWQPFFPQIEYFGQVWDIQTYHGALYVFGSYHFVGDTTSYGLLRFDGRELCAIGGNMPYGSSGHMAFFQNSLYLPLFSEWPPDLAWQWVGYLPLDGLVPDTCITISQTSVQERERAVLQVYPNPASNTLTVTFGNGQVLQEIYVLDMTGRIVYRTSAIGARSIQLDVASYPTGVYSIMAIGSGYSSSCRFIKD